MLPQSLLDLLPPSSLPGDVAGSEAPTLPTGLEALDDALPGGGVPRGKLTEIVGRRGSGTATLLRRMVEETLARAGWVAYIDAARTLAPRDWAHLGTEEGLWMIRPKDPMRAGWCADVLLRSGAFNLVVIDSAPILTRSVSVRLTRLAREAGTALVAVGDETVREGSRNGGGERTRSSMLGGAVRLRVQRDATVRRKESRSGPLLHVPAPPFPHEAAGHPPGPPRHGERTERRMTIVVEKGGGGTHRTVEVSCAIGVARRLCTHPQVPDRRGVARRQTGRSGSERRAAPVAISAGSTAGSGKRAGGSGRVGAESEKPNDGGIANRVLPRKRRCAEPEYGVGGRHIVHGPVRPEAPPGARSRVG